MANEVSIGDAQRQAALKYLGETGGASVASATGTTADPVYAGSGNATEISLLKGIYAQLVLLVAKP